MEIASERIIARASGRLHPSSSPLHMTLSSSTSHATCSSSDGSRTLSRASDQRSATHHDAPIPTSVKGAPAHLRRAIRKRQNSESAKRSRLRRKQASHMFQEQFDMQCSRIRMLEARVRALHDMLESRRRRRAPSAPPAATGALDVTCEQGAGTWWTCTSTLHGGTAEGHERGGGMDDGARLSRDELPLWSGFDGAALDAAGGALDVAIDDVFVLDALAAWLPAPTL